MHGIRVLECATCVSSCTGGTTVPVVGESEHAKALTALADGQLQHLVQLLIGVVGGEAQLVKTSHKRGKPGFDHEVTISSIKSVYQPFVFLLTTCVQWARCCVWGQQ